MEIAKALILACRETGERPWPAASAGNRHLFPVANRPILDHSLEALSHGGILEATVLAGPDDAPSISRAVADGSRWGLSVRCAEHDSRGGLAGALERCRGFIGDEPVLVGRGDALLRERWHAHIAAFSREGLDALGLRLLPTCARAGTQPTPGYLLSPRALSILAGTPGAAADPLRGIRREGGRVRVQPVDGCLPCHGDQDALLECNRRVLEDIRPAHDAGSLHDSEIQGAVVVHPTALVERSTLRGPLIVGPGARVFDAYVGPYTSIGADVLIEGAEIEHSIVLDGAQLRFVASRMESSVIGRGARIVRAFRQPNALRFSVGDGAEVSLS